MSELLKLAERVEQASGPDRELDLAIGLAALGWQWIDDEFNYSERWVILDYGAANNVGWYQGGIFPACIPSPTASLDVTRTLIDPADEWELSTMYTIARATVGLNRDHQTSWPGYGSHEGCDPVLALLAAALRARDND